MRRKIPAFLRLSQWIRCEAAAQDALQPLLCLDRGKKLQAMAFDRFLER